MSEPKNSKSDGNDKKRRIFRAELPTDESIMKKYKNISDSRIGFQDMVESQYDSLTEEDFEKLDEIEKTIIKIKNRLASGMRSLGSEKRNNHWDELNFLRSKAVHGDEKAIRFFINMIEQSWPLAPDSGIHQFAIDTLGESAYIILLTGKDNIENDMIEALSFPLRNWKIREFGFRSAASLGHFINNIDVINLLIEEYINKNNSVQANLNNIFQDTAGNTKYGDQITNIKFRTKILNILNSLISEEDNRSFFREKFIQLLENKDFTELINVDYDLKKIFENEKELEYFLTMETIDSIITTITVSDRFSNLKYEEIRNLYPKITQLLLQTLEKLSSQENDVSRWVSKEIEEITIEILKIMCRIKDSSVVEVIVNIMERNDSWEIKSEAARALGQIGNVEALDPILDIVTTQEEEIIRQKQHIMFKFIESLGNLGNSEITGLLTNWMYYLHICTF